MVPINLTSPIKDAVKNRTTWKNYYLCIYDIDHLIRGLIEDANHGWIEWRDSLWIVRIGMYIAGEWNVGSVNGWIKGCMDPGVIINVLIDMYRWKNRKIN